MKPVILPCVLDENGHIVISKEALDSLIDKAYEAGVEDGRKEVLMPVRAEKVLEIPDVPITAVYAAPVRYPYNYSTTVNTMFGKMKDGEEWTD